METRMMIVAMLKGTTKTTMKVIMEIVEILMEAVTVIVAIPVEAAHRRMTHPWSSPDNDTSNIDKNYYDLTYYVNDVNRQNTQQLMTYDDEGNLRDAYVYGNNDERLTRDHIQNDNPTESGHRALDTYLYDGRGSVSQVTNEQSIIVGNQQYRYDPFGKMIQNKPDNEIMFGYNGEEYNPITDTQYLRARYYDVGMSRFISKDTYLGDTQNPLTRNLYAYTANDPVNHKDPSGNYIVDGDGNKYIKLPNSNTYKNISSPTVTKTQTSTPIKNQASSISQKKQAAEANTKKSKCDAEDIDKLLSELVKSYNSLKELRSIGIPAASMMLAKGGRNVWSEYADETTISKTL